MSVQDILAAARGGGSSTPAKSAAASPAVASPTTAPTKEKAKGAASKAASPPSGPKDTMSILAAARKDAKPGPVSKAAAAQGAAPAERKSKPKPVAPSMPQKPAYAHPPAPVADDDSRRNFIGYFVGSFFGSFLAVGFFSLGLTNLLWLLGFARFMFPNVLIEPPSTFRVGFPDDFSPGAVETKFKAQFGVWIVRYEYEGQTQIYALKSVCTHLGCTPNWLEGEQKFKCPCHGSGFYKDGINFEGPAPRPLERYAIRIATDGQIEVDKSKKFNEEKGQWKDSDSFVSV